MALYSLDEVFQMAAQMEESGREFYETVAKHSPNEMAGTLCRHLAAEEQKHFQTFQSLRKRLGKGKAPRVSMEQVGTTEAAVREKVVPLLEEARSLGSGGCLGDVLRAAAKLETDAVAFYTRIRAAMAPGDVPAIDAIIAEEKRHEKELREACEELKA